MELLDLTVRSFRNLRDSRFRFNGSTNVVLGPNGAGKTSLLEALVVLGNLRSFRTNRLRRAVSHGQNTFRLTGTVSFNGREHRLQETVAVGPPVSRFLEVDGNSVEVKDYLQFLPIFAITGHDRDLVVGGPEGRRALLDRFVFLLRPSYIEELRTYRRARRQRNAALAAGASDTEIEAWEIPLAGAAARVVEARRQGAIALGRLFLVEWKELSTDASPEITLEYRNEPWMGVIDGVERVEDLYQQRYNETRTRDRQMGFTVDGPHRHDLSLKTDGRSVRYVLSSGQTKGVAAALRLAMLAQVEKERNESFPVIVDDVDAELDGDALANLIRRLGNNRQLFLSSTSEQVAELAGRRRHRIEIENGICVSQEAASDD